MRRNRNFSFLYIHIYFYYLCAYSIIKVLSDKATRLIAGSHFTLAITPSLYGLVSQVIPQACPFYLSISQPGGDDGTRTRDFRLAKAALSQLSYIPGIFHGMVGLTGFEPVTPALSAQCSNQLSYRPAGLDLSN
jgi:hypothetical protein